jgi:oligopeptide transport system substrate-binding protein
VRQVFEPLLRVDANLRPPQCYDVSPDGLVWTFHLRSDGRWSDGEPVTAKDFAYSLHRLLDPETAAQYADFFLSAGVADVRALDDRTLEIQLSEPFGPLPNLVALWIAAPLRQDVVECYGEDWAREPETYVGNGPFVLSEWVHQDHMTFVPNPRYHGPQPSLRKMTFLMVDNDGTDYAAYRNGERDWALVPDADVVAVSSDPRSPRRSASCRR